MTISTTNVRMEVPLDMLGSHKIVGLADATDSKDAMNLGQDMRNYWL